ncbi:MAG: T9SS type A sorting domain-containing protein [Bacteroidales bacterium]|nr:T9SS type A sorting domain-containing protein [Bacteroidales bacterium]
MKKKHFIPSNRIIITFCLFIIGLNSAMAQTFLGTVNNLWSNPDNWLDGLKPNEESEYVSINADVVVDEDVTIQNLYDAIPCTLTIQSGKKLVVISTIVWDKGGSFILEDEAQLLNDDPIQILFKKTIEAYDEQTHPWDIIASPIAESFMPTTENGFLTEPETGYALLAYDEASHSFLNFKEENFPIINGKGYLYANALDTTLLFTGFTQGSGMPVEISLDFHSSNNNLAGYNFVGNPLPCNAYPSKSYYVMDPITYRLTPVTASSATAIKPCTGIFVKADAVNETIAFSRNDDYSQHQGYIAIYLTQAEAHDPLDQAIISFNPNDNLGKFTLNAEAPKVYFTDNNQNLAIISIDSLDALPLRFKAYENGNYTLHFEVNEMGISTLNLIDNIAGSQTDLLSNPHYTFSANINDYASRFKVVFKPDYGIEEFGDDVFAYYSDGTIHLFGLESSKESSLQICDLVGRTVYSETINNRDGVHTVSTKLIPGIYLLRLTEGNCVQTQKIVIK